MSLAVSQRFTVDDLAAMPDGDLYELASGALVRRTTSPISAFVAGEIYARLRQYCVDRPIAVALPDGAGFALRTPGGDTVQKPDASVVLKTRLPGGELPSTRFDFAPDLAVEVLSPTDSYWELDIKIREYFRAGTSMAWVARPDVRRIVVVLPDHSETSLGPDDAIAGEPLLPGLKFRVGEVFP